MKVKHMVRLNEAEFEALFAQMGMLPADVREAMRAVLGELPDLARAVYDRENIHDPNVPLREVVETVLYSFDRRNRERVAGKMGLAYDEMVLLLVGFVLGHDESCK